jgi:protease I
MSNIAILLGPDFEDSEYEIPVKALRGAGHAVTIVGVKAGEKLRGKKGESTAVVDIAAGDAEVSDFSAVIIPGGYSPDQLRTDANVIDFLERAARTNTLVAAICHGPSLLIEAELCRGLRVTSWPSIRKDLVNAGAHWEDESVVRDGNFVTSRKPSDLREFSETVLSHLSMSSERSTSLTSSQL